MFGKGIKAIINNIWEYVIEDDDRITELENVNYKLDENLNKEFDAVRNGFQSNLDRITGVERNMRKLIPKLSQHDTDIAKAADQLKMFDENLPKSFDGVYENINHLDRKCSLHHREIVQLKASLIALNREVFNILKGMSAHRQDIEDNKIQHDFFFKRFCEIQGEIDEADKPKPVRKSRKKKPQAKKA